jgi:hypothetical protein
MAGSDCKSGGRDSYYDGQITLFDSENPEQIKSGKSV